MTASEAESYGLNNTFWNGLTEENRELYRRVRPLRKSTYTVHNPIGRIEETLETLDQDARRLGGRLELCPDFQRGHVWSQAKQVAFIEAIFRGTAPMVIRFNCPSWGGKKSVSNGLELNSVQCIDGLQRLTAMREFVAGKFKVFGDQTFETLKGTTFDPSRIGFMWVLEMFDITSRDDLLQFYLDINSGGVVHSDEELTRVRGLLADARAGATPAETSAPASPRKRARKA